MIACNNVKLLVEVKSTKKKFGGPNLGQRSQNLLQNLFFCHLRKFDSLVFLEIADNDTLQQCLTSSTGKTHEKCFWDQIWAKTAQNQAQVFCHFLKLGSLVFL